MTFYHMVHSSLFPSATAYMTPSNGPISEEIPQGNTLSAPFCGNKSERTWKLSF